MIRNFTKDSDFLKREPVLSRLLTAEELSAIPDIAFSDFCIELRNEKGSIPVNVMLPFYIAQNKALTASGTLSASFYDPNKRLNRFVIDKTVTACTGTNKIILKGSQDNTAFVKIGEITLDSSASQSVKFPSSFNYYQVIVEVGGTLNITAADLFLVESPFDHCIESLCLTYAYDRCIKTDDVFVTLADKYRKEYEKRFQNLNFWYDSDSNGVNDTNVEGASNLTIFQRWG